MTKPPAPRPAGRVGRPAVGGRTAARSGAGLRGAADGGAGPRPGGERLAGAPRPGTGAKAPKPPTDVRFLGFMTVFPMVVGSALCMLLGSLLTQPPSSKTIEKYFPSARASVEPARV